VKAGSAQSTLRQVSVAAVLCVLIVACGDTAGSKSPADDVRNLAASEALIDAFYSFEREAIQTRLLTAEGSAPAIIFYQGWAQGGNYQVKKRMPCEVKEPNVVSCSITVQDDLMLALGIDFNVTDTFTMSFLDGNIVAVDTSSNDLAVFWQARDWVKEKLPELIEEPCQGIWEGGPTPGDCVRAMVEGYRRFAASDDFPQQ
jgi:hypothetical protein